MLVSAVASFCSLFFFENKFLISVFTAPIKKMPEFAKDPCEISLTSVTFVPFFFFFLVKLQLQFFLLSSGVSGLTPAEKER